MIQLGSYSMAYHCHPREHFIPSNLICRAKKLLIFGSNSRRRKGETELREDQNDDNRDNDKKELGDYDGDPYYRDDQLTMLTMITMVAMMIVVRPVETLKYAV